MASEPLACASPMHLCYGRDWALVVSLFLLQITPLCLGKCKPNPTTTRRVDLIILRNWEYHPDMAGKQPNIQVAVQIVADASGSKKGYKNLASAFYRKCPSKATDPPCQGPLSSPDEDLPTMKNSVLVDVDPHGEMETCEGPSDTKPEDWALFNNNGQEMERVDLDHGEADAMAFALRMATTVGQPGKKNYKRPPPLQFKDLPGEESTWMDAFISIQGIYAHGPMERKKSNLLKFDMESHVYPLSPPIWLSDVLKKKGKFGQNYWLGCKDAMDPAVFAEADVMKSLNKSLLLWTKECKRQRVPMRRPVKRNSIMIMIMVIVILAGLAVFGVFLRKRLREDKLEDSQKREVELSTEFESGSQVSSAGSHKW